MTTPVLVPCPSCARHIATSETACPFCASAVPDDLADRAIPANNRRLTRFAMFTFATTAATAVGVLAACGESGMSIPFYGASCTEGDACAGLGDVGTGFNDEAGYGSQPDANLLDASPDDATFIDANDDSGDASDASGEDAD